MRLAIGVDSLRFVLEPAWPSLLAALALGIVAGLAAWSRRPMRGSGLAELALAAAALGLGLAALGLAWIPGRAGYRLEIVAALVLAYLAGCLAGAACRALAGRLAARAAEAGSP